MKIFWAWQSDTPGEIGRFFVRDALHNAIKKIKSQLEVVEPTERETRGALELDHDRKGVPGSPDLARTIMEKIEAASVFVADVTPVGIVPASESNRNPKRLINSNVAIELGYCLRSLSDAKLLMVMNEHYGERGALPFDIAHKGGPMLYNLVPGSDKPTIAAAAAKLTAAFVEAIELCIVNEVAAKKAVLTHQVPVESGSARFFTPGETLASIEGKELIFHHDRVAYLRIRPVAPGTSIGRAQVAKVFNERRPVVMSVPFGSGTAMPNGYGFIVFDYDGQTSMTALTQGFRNGELWGLTSQLFKPHRHKSALTGLPGTEVILPMITLEKVYVRTLKNYIEVQGALGIAPPYEVVCGLEGLKDVYLTVPTGGPFGNGNIIGPIREKSLRKSYTLASRDDAAVSAILRDFFTETYDLAYVARADVWTDVLLAQHELPSRQ